MVEITNRTSNRNLVHITDCSMQNNFPLGMLVQSSDDTANWSGNFTDYGEHGQTSSHSKLSMLVYQNSSNDLG